jgi:hypothetical protein
MNYGELKTAIQQYLEQEEDSFVANIPLFVRLAEEDIYRQVQLPDLIFNVTSECTVNEPYVATPLDYLSAYSLAVIVDGVYHFLLSKDVSFIREYWPDPTDTDVPKYFAQFDEDAFLIAPTPDEEYPLELHYFLKPASLSSGDDETTTWLSENAENTILFGTLLHGYIYLKGDQDVIAAYKAAFDKAVADLKTIAEGRTRKDQYRKSDQRIPV